MFNVLKTTFDRLGVDSFADSGVFSVGKVLSVGGSVVVEFNAAEMLTWFEDNLFQSYIF